MGSNGKTKPSGPLFCQWCANGNHRQCPGDGCACADDRGHRPSATLAARMCASVRPDMRKLPEQERARMWRTEVNA